MAICSKGLKMKFMSMQNLMSGMGLWLLATLPGWAADWPQWRGLHRDAVWRETGMPEVFPSGGLKVRWRGSVGPGHASPVVANGRV